VLATTRIAFGDCGLAQGDITDFADELHWRNPKRPPGLHVMVHAADEGLLVTLAQDLFGPIGPPDAYRCAKKSLTAETSRALRQRRRAREIMNRWLHNNEFGGHGRPKQ
jgi:hypothetical protein